MNLAKFVLARNPMRMVWLTINLVFGSMAGLSQDPVYMANGIKIGELSHESVVIWTRLTKNRERILEGPQFLKTIRDGENKLAVKHISAEDQIPQGISLDQIEGSVPGALGELRLTYWEAADTKTRKSTAWIKTSEERGHSHKFYINQLMPSTKYRFKVEGRPLGIEKPSVVRRSLVTTTEGPEKSMEEIRFTVATCHDYLRRDDSDNGHIIYPSMARLRPHFFVHAGDIEYFDKTDPYATRLDLARFKFTRLYSMVFQRAFHMRIPSYFMKDDHDTLKNDCWPGQTYGELTFQQGVDLFKEQFPVPNDKTYRTKRWGKDLQIWFVEGRDYRSPNSMKDGPSKSIWGKEQREWLFKTLKESNATYKILFTPTPIVGPDRKNKKDNYANSGFMHEGTIVRNELAQHQNLIVICGDRHWQYASVDSATGLREFSCGAGSEEHAGGFSQNNKSPMHKFLAIEPGFISGTLTQKNSPELTIRFHGTKGDVKHSELIELKK